MTQSLRWRLMVAAACSIVAALALSGFVLMLLFERHVVRRVEHELQSYTKQLAASITIDGQSRPELATELSDPRFEQPYSGLYWQVAEGGKVVLRSRSLWDQSLRISGSAQGKSTGYRREESGPAGESLIVFQRDIFMAAGQSERALTLTAALDWSEVASARTDFLQDLAIALSLLAVFLLGASWLQIRVGLGPLSTIRSRINDVRRGSQRRLEGAFPNEVSPLVGELNALLDAQDESVTRARYGAADLAHGLKTPLTILQAECRALRSCGMPQAAAEIEEQVEHMRRRVERHLAIARL
ncbi:MAG: histidine kinase dimerization/phospho-acceptor domain-containing protein, partial [Hyphomicrobiaceae bacterium]